MALIKCSECGNQVSDKAAACPKCGAPISSTGQRCPKCGSTNIERISGLKKGFNAFMWGAFAANTVMNDFECKSCGNKFKQ